MHKIIHTHILEAKQLVEYILNQKSRMHLTADKDAEFGDALFDVSRNENLQSERLSKLIKRQVPMIF